MHFLSVSGIQFSLLMEKLEKHLEKKKKKKLGMKLEGKKKKRMLYVSSVFPVGIDNPCTELP